MKPNWPTKKIGEIREEIKKEKAPIGAMPYIEIGNVNIESKKVNFTEKGAVKGSVFCPEGSILISRVRPTRGAVVLVNKKYAVSSAFTIIQPKINPRLLFYFLAWNKNFFEYLGNLQKGTSYPSVRESDILDFEVSFPEDKVEQQKIVYILDSIQDAIRTQEKIVEKTKELKKSMMADLFKYGGPSFRKGRKLKKTEIGEIPENWEVVEADKFCTSVTDGTHETPKKSEEGYYLITSKNLKEGKLDFKDAYKIGQKDFDKVNKRSKVNQYDVLFGMIGTIGSPILITEKNPQFAIKNVGLFKNGGDCIKGNYLSYYLDSGYAQYFVQKNTTRTAQSYLTLGLLRKFPILKPPITEIKEVIKILQTIDQKIEVEQKKKALYEELFKTMLNKLMTGKIKVDNLKL